MHLASAGKHFESSRAALSINWLPKEHEQLPATACMLQAEAERRKRAQILESEGDRQSKINVAEGDKAQVILSSEAAKQDAINRATGQAVTVQHYAAIYSAVQAYCAGKSCAWFSWPIDSVPLWVITCFCCPRFIAFYKFLIV